MILFDKDDWQIVTRDDGRVYAHHKACIFEGSNHWSWLRTDARGECFNCFEHVPEDIVTVLTLMHK